MFRRKDEDTYSAGATTGAQPVSAPAATSGSNNNESATLVYNPAPAASTPQASSSPGFAPTPAAATPRAEASRPQTATPPSASSFRPAAPSAARAHNEAKAPAATSTPQSGAEKNSAKGNRRILTVGNEIMLTGEISSCDLVVVEGNVDAKMSKVHTLEIAQNGSFKGSAQIENAEISGLFEGELIVKNRLVVYSNGKVRGKITYGEIEIERGGELTGEVKTTASAGAEAGKPAATKAA
jgi:cytoskeletal protein CcmA (bactofilin family)